MNNKPSTYLLTLFLFNIVCISAFAQGYKIDIQIDEFQQDKAYLAYYLGDSQFVKDTAVVEDGQFKFQGEEKLEKGIYLVVLPPDNQSFELIIDQDQQFSLTTSMDDLVENLEVTGSAENELFIREIHLKTPIIEKIRAIDEQIKTTEDETLVTQLEQKQKELRQSIVERENFIISEYPNERYSKLTSATRDPLIPEELEGEARFYYYFNHYFDSIDLSDSFFLRTPILYNKVRTYLETLTVQHQDSLSQSVDRVAQLTKANDEIYQWAMIYMVNKYAKSNIVGQDAVYCHIVEHYYAKGLCPWIGDERLQKMKNQVAKLKPTLLHSPAPQLSATDRKGKSQTLELLEGNFVVLYFWNPIVYIVKQWLYSKKIGYFTFTTVVIIGCFPSLSICK